MGGDQAEHALAVSDSGNNTEQQALDNIEPFSPAMRKALEQLADSHKGQLEAVIAVDIKGDTYEECAYQNGISVGTVRSRLHRGREKLKTIYTRYREEAQV